MRRDDPDYEAARREASDNAVHNGGAAAFVAVALSLVVVGAASMMFDLSSWGLFEGVISGALITSAFVTIVEYRADRDRIYREMRRARLDESDSEEP